MIKHLINANLRQIRVGGGSAASAEDNIRSFVRNGVFYEVAVKVSQNGAISFSDYASSGSYFQGINFSQFGADEGPENPAAFWFFDRKGEELLNHWLGGSGKNLNFSYDKNWSNYMRSNEILLDRLQRIARARGYFMNIEGKTKTNEVSGNKHFEIENGYNTGYGMLHGTNF